MIILSNCLKKDADEGCLKVAVSLTKRIKAADPATTVIGYERECDLCDHFLQLNKWMLSGKLIRLLRKEKQPVLFIPFSAKMRSTALRTFMISLFARGKVRLVQSMYSPMGKLAKWLVKLSRAELVCLSESSYTYYREKLGKQVRYLKTGVDTEKFHPVSPEKKIQLREKYNIPVDKTVVLHVGHLKTGRNLQRLLELGSDLHGVAVVSTHTPQQQDETLREQLLQKENITLIDSFLPQIQELYQLSDVYLFPVVYIKGCIDAPLSAMEAAACGLPVVTTAFGELKTLLGQNGFYELAGEDPAKLNALLRQAAEEKKNPREAILAYDWRKAVQTLYNNDAK